MNRPQGGISAEVRGCKKLSEKSRAKAKRRRHPRYCADGAAGRPGAPAGASSTQEGPRRERQATRARLEAGRSPRPRRGGRGPASLPGHVRAGRLQGTGRGGDSPRLRRAPARLRCPEAPQAWVPGQLSPSAASRKVKAARGGGDGDGGGGRGRSPDGCRGASPKPPIPGSCASRAGRRSRAGQAGLRPRREEGLAKHPRPGPGAGGRGAPRCNFSLEAPTRAPARARAPPRPRAHPAARTPARPPSIFSSSFHPHILK